MWFNLTWYDPALDNLRRKSEIKVFLRGRYTLLAQVDTWVINACFPDVVWTNVYRFYLWITSLNTSFFKKFRSIFKITKNVKNFDAILQNTQMTLSLYTGTCIYIAEISYQVYKK